MRIAFIDPSDWRYTLETPYERPFGGSHSAMCYLAEEIKRLGHIVTIFNGNLGDGCSRGVNLRSFRQAWLGRLFEDYDILVVLNSAIGHRLRRDMDVAAPIVLWNQHAHDQDPVRALSGIEERNSWTGFAFVSDWQRECFERHFGVPSGKSMVMRNAVSPACLDTAVKDPWFVRGDPPILVYTSTPFRGLDVLLAAFPTIRRAIPAARLRIYSSMGVYQVRREDDEFAPLYSQARAIDGVEYVGSVGQNQLARELNGVAALAYPSTFAETSCISVMEAMATGAAVLSTTLGAIPETTGGHASLVEWQPDKRQLAKSFSEMSIYTLLEMRRDPGEAAEKRIQRIGFIRESHTWAERAKAWEEWLIRIGA